MKVLTAKFIPEHKFTLETLPLDKCSPMAPMDQATFDWVHKTIVAEGMLHPVIAMTKSVRDAHPHMGSSRIIMPEKDFFIYVGNNRYYAAIKEDFTHIEAILIDSNEKLGQNIRYLQNLMFMKEKEWDVYKETGNLDHVYEGFK